MRLKLKPAVHFRGRDDHVGAAPGAPVTLTSAEGRYELTCGGA